MLPARPAFAFAPPAAVRAARRPSAPVMAPKKRLRQATLFGGGLARPRPAKAARLHWRSSARGALLALVPPAWAAAAAAATAAGTARPVHAFDMDGVLIRPAGGGAHPAAASDWAFLSPRVAPALRASHDAGAALAVFTNQAGIAAGKTSAEDVQARVDAIAAALGVPVAFYVATRKDRFRKPALGMWRALLKDLGGEERVDYSASFFVGDAAGRPKRPGARADFADSDRKFALNAGLRFFTPEMHFDGAAKDTLATVPLKGYDARKVDVKVGRGGGDPASDQALRSIVTPPEVAELLLPNRDEAAGTGAAPPALVLMVGEPASGKSTFAERHLQPRGFVVVDGEMQKSPTAAKTAKLVASLLASGKSVAVAMTNRNKKARALLLEKARAAVPAAGALTVVALVMRTPPDVVDHLNSFREHVTSVGEDGVPARPRVPAVAINTFRANYAAPDPEEEPIDHVGFVEFVPHVESEEHAANFRHFMS